MKRVLVAASLLVLGGSALLVAGSLFDPSDTADAERIVVLGTKSELYPFSNTPIVHAPVVHDLGALEGQDVSLLFITPSGASSIEPGSLAPMHRRRIVIGGLDVDLATLWPLTGQAAVLKGVDAEMAAQMIEDATWKGDSPPYSFTWSGC
jgi:hypothetical protein